MTRMTLQDINAEQLVQQFAELAVQQETALLENDIGEATRLIWRLKDIEDELKRRVGDQRTALMELYRHPNMQVRVKAALATLAVARQAAREQLEAVKASKWQPAAFEAGMSLRTLDRGVYKPK